MDPLTPKVVEVDPCAPDVLDIISVHLELMHASSPACSVHAMSGEALKSSGARFFAIFDGSEAIAMGAIKAIKPGHGELKSMHVRQARRGEGLAKLILDHFLEVARDEGLIRVSLETGSQEAFAAARGFYGRAGFDTCPPFEGYALDPNSVFMTRVL